ncbi:hypothetical protein [Paenibacillus sp. NPDC058174]|uniref:hypothetical protein n=1 Tax=Paenibacillus sp. NPDC058174 TaxID=3346366 RepID=UPI0036D77824
MIESKGAIVVHIAKINAEDSPFSNQSGTDNIIYKVTYTIDDRTHTAWYRGVKTINNIHNQTPRGQGGYGESWIFE